jgi:hypothetical protein
VGAVTRRKMSASTRNQTIKSRPSSPHRRLCYSLKPQNTQIILSRPKLTYFKVLHYPSFSIEGPKESPINGSHDNWYSGRDLKSGLCECPVRRECYSPKLQLLCFEISDAGFTTQHLRTCSGARTASLYGTALQCLAQAQRLGKNFVSFSVTRETNRRATSLM